MDDPKNDEMIEKPDIDNSFVTFRVKEEVGDYSLNDEDVVEVHEGDTMVGSWREFKGRYTQHTADRSL